MLGMPSRVGIDRGWFCGLSNQEAAKRMAKKKHRKLLRKTRVQRRNKK
jgi:hypothetical protein